MDEGRYYQPLWEIIKDTPFFRGLVNQDIEEGTRPLQEFLLAAEKTYQEEAKAAGIEIKAVENAGQSVVLASKIPSIKAKIALENLRIVQEEQEILLGLLQQIVIDHVKHHHSGLIKLAQKQVKTIQEPDLLRSIFLQLIDATDEIAAINILLYKDETEITDQRQVLHSDE